MAIEKTTDTEQANLDDMVTGPYSWYELLHRLAHGIGYPAFKEAVEQAEAKYTEEPEAEFTMDVPVIIPRQLLRLALERFEQTHDPEELKAAAPSAQAYFGAGVGQLLQQLADQAGVPVTMMTADGQVLGGAGPDEPEGEPDDGTPRKTNLH